MKEKLIDKALEAAGIPKRDRYTIKDAQKVIGASIETIRRKLADGSLRGQRFGKKWIFIYHDDLENFLG